jgi:hypothetical protein
VQKWRDSRAWRRAWAAEALARNVLVLRGYKPLDEYARMGSTMSDQAFEAAFLDLLQRQPKRDTPLAVPADAPALVRIWAEHQPPRLARRTVFGTTVTAAAAIEDFGLGAVDWLDPQKSILLGNSAGGECLFGVHWTSGATGYFQLDLEWEAYENPPIVAFDGAKAFWWDVHDREKGRISPELAALFTAAGVDPGAT